MFYVSGAKYKDDCPAEDKIPIYLIVMGAVLIFRNLSSLCSKMCSNDDDAGDDQDNKSAPQKCCDSILDLFMFCWFISGNYWIYHIYEPSYSKSDDYCNKTLYLFSFWLMTASYIFIAFICCCFCSIGICYVALKDDEE